MNQCGTCGSNQMGECSPEVADQPMYRSTFAELAAAIELIHGMEAVGWYWDLHTAIEGDYYCVAYGPQSWKGLCEGPDAPQGSRPVIE